MLKKLRNRKTNAITNIPKNDVGFPRIIWNNWAINRLNKEVENQIKPKIKEILITLPFVLSQLDLKLA